MAKTKIWDDKEILQLWKLTDAGKASIQITMWNGGDLKCVKRWTNYPIYS